MTEKDNQKLEQDNKALRKEQDVLSNSINQLKEERDLLENKNKFLKDEIGKKSTNLSIVSTEESLAIESKDKAVEENNKQQLLLEDINTKIGGGLLKLSSINNNISSIQKVYDENKRNADNQLDQLTDRHNEHIKDLDDIFDKYKKNTDDEKALIYENIERISKEIGIKQISNNVLGESNKRLEQDIIDLEKEKSKLDGIIKQRNEDCTSLINKINEMNGIIELAKSEFSIRQKQSEETTSNLVKAREELAKILTKIGFIQKKEDSLKSFEAYIKETSNKYGLDYQPYEG